MYTCCWMSIPRHSAFCNIVHYSQKIISTLTSALDHTLAYVSVLTNVMQV